MPRPPHVDAFLARLADDRTDPVAWEGYVSWLCARGDLQGRLARAFAEVMRHEQGSAARAAADAAHTAVSEEVDAVLLAGFAAVAEPGLMLFYEEGLASRLDIRDEQPVTARAVRRLLDAAPTITELDLSGHPLATDRFLSTLAALPHLRSLSLWLSPLDGSFLDAFVAAEHRVHTLQLTGCGLAAGALQKAARLPCLRALWLAGSPEACADLSPLAGMTGLTGLGLEARGKGAAALRVLSGLTRLERLHLAHAELLDDAGLASLPVLRELQVSHAAVSAAGVVPRGGGLEVAALDYCVLEEDVLSGLARHRGLTRLRLSGCAGLRGDRLPALAGHPTLRHVDLGSCTALRGDMAARLGRLPALVSVNLNYCPDVGDHTVLGLSDATTLERLSLSGTAVSARVIPMLADLPCLRTLSLVGCPLRGADLAPLAKAPALKQLLVSRALAGTVPPLPAAVVFI